MAVGCSSHAEKQAQLLLSLVCLQPLNCFNSALSTGSFNTGKFGKGSQDLKTQLSQTVNKGVE